jgi:glyoxylase I family protein
MAINTRGMVPLIQVYDMPTSIHFYCDQIGFKLAQQSWPGDDYDWAMLELNDAFIMLNTAYDKGERPASPDLSRIAGHEDITIYFGCPDVEAAYTELLSRNVVLERPFITKYGYRAIHVKDPDGYGLCFHWPDQDSGGL